EPAEETKNVHRALYLASALGERLAFFAREQFRQLRFARLQKLRRFAQHTSTGDGSHRAPSGEGGLRGSDGRGGVFLSAQRIIRDDFAGVRGVLILKSFSGAGRNPFAADKILKYTHNFCSRQ